MRKFLDFVKKQLLIIASCVFIAFTALLIVVSCLPKGGKYEYSFSAMGVTMEVDYIFEGDKLTLDANIMGEFTTETTDYKIQNGKLYVVNLETNEWEYCGKINAYEIVIEGTDETTNLEMEVVLECKATKAVRTLSIVMMCISGVLALGSASIVVFEKKGIIKIKGKVAEESVTSGENNAGVTENSAQNYAVVIEESAETQAKTAEDVQEGIDETEPTETTGEKQ